jgi:hypothetical protein
MNKYILLLSIYSLCGELQVNAQTTDNNSTASLLRGPGPVIASCSPVVVDSLTGECTPKKGFYGNAGSATGGAVIRIYDRLNVLQLPNAGSIYALGTVTANTDGSWVWKCNGNNTCPSGANNCIPPGTYLITQQSAGLCESQPLVVCIGASTFSTTPVITTSITPSTTAISGSSGAVATVISYSRSGSVYTQIGTTVADSSGAWSQTGLTFVSCDTIVVLASQAGYCSSSFSAAKIVNAGTTTAPVVTGSYCTTSLITSVSGTSTEAAGTVIQVYENSIAEGSTTTVQSNGTWTASTGISIAAGSSITARATGTCKIQSAASASVPVRAITSDASLAVTSTVREGSTSVSGSATTGNTVNLYINGVNIGSTVAASGTWTISGIATSAIFINGTLTVTATQSGKCESATKAGPVILCSPPSGALAIAANTDTVCAGGTVQVTIQASQTIAFYRIFIGGVASGNTVTGTGGTITLTSVPINTSCYLRIKATKAGYTGCTTVFTDSIRITVINPQATAITVTPSLHSCEGDTIILKSTLTGGNTWNTGSTADSIKITASGTYTVIHSGTYGCTAATNTTVALNAHPAVPVISGPSPVGYCYGDSILLTTSYTPGLLYQWRRYGSDIPNEDTTFYTLNRPGKYRVRATNSNGCTSISNFYQVTGGPDKPIVIANGLTTICSIGGSVELSTDVVPGITYHWRKYGIAISGATGITYTATGAGPYTCVATNIYGCTRSSDPVNITLTTVTPVVTAAGSLQICQGDSVKLSVTPVIGNTYQWKKSGNVVAGATGYDYYATSEAEYKCVVTTFMGCSGTSNQVAVDFTPQKPSVTANGPVNLCTGDSVMLAANVIAGVTYSWRKYSNIVPLITSSNLTVNKTGRYKCVITNTAGCSRASDPVDITVLACRTPIATIADSEPQINIYPNPSSGDFNIEVDPNLNTTFEITVNDLQGRKIPVNITDMQNGVHQLSGLESGVYLTTVTAGGNTHKFRLYKTH